MNTRKFFMLCVWLLAISIAQAQVPQLISYQAVARDLTGKVLSERPISVQVEILQGSNQGTAVYTETHSLTTTKTGTINLLIGGGDAQAGTFTAIDWSKSPYFLRLGMKQEQETDYTEVSNTQMVSMPYALYAEKAGSVENDESVVTEADYTIISADDGSEIRDLYNALAGKTITRRITYEIKDKTTKQLLYYSTDYHFRFSLVYLTGKDLQLTAEMKGLQKNEEHCSESSIGGRMYGFIEEFPPSEINEEDQVSTDITIKDKAGNVIAVYPFTIQLENLDGKSHTIIYE